MWCLHLLSHLVTITWQYRSFSCETRDIWATSLFKQLWLMAFPAISGMSPGYLWFAVIWLGPDRRGPALREEVIAWEHCRAIQFLRTRRDHKFGETWVLWRDENICKGFSVPGWPLPHSDSSLGRPLPLQFSWHWECFLRKKGGSSQILLHGARSRLENGPATTQPG